MSKAEIKMSSFLSELIGKELQKSYFCTKQKIAFVKPGRVCFIEGIH